MAGLFQRIRRRGDEGSEAAPVAPTDDLPPTAGAEQPVAPLAGGEQPTTQQPWLPSPEPPTQTWAPGAVGPAAPPSSTGLWTAGAVAPPTAATEATAEPTVPAGSEPADPLRATRPSFLDRGRLRRRLRYLRRVRELGFRDLGGLVFDQHRFAARRPELVEGKLQALEAVDRELRALERALGDRREFIDLREPGIAACPRCSSLHGSDARFCPSCGLRLSGPRAFAEVADGPHVVDPEAGVIEPPPPPPPEPEMAPPATAADDQPTQVLPPSAQAHVAPGGRDATPGDSQDTVPDLGEPAPAANGNGSVVADDPAHREA